MSQTWADALAELWAGEILRDAAMSQWCTLKIGGPARIIALPADLSELTQLLGVLKKLEVRWEVIGGGSNILFADRGFDGVIVALGRKFGAISRDGAGTDGAVIVRAEAGCSLGKLVNWCTVEGLSGLEFAAGIPGSVGGAISMNAGAWGRDMSEVLAAVTFVSATGELEKKTRAELAFAYRRLEKEGKVVAIGEFLLAPDRQENIVQKVKDVVARRKKTQPQGVASAGSFFKNPKGDAAGRLIEAAGLKGSHVGGAMVSPVHANFIVNTGGATASEVRTLMRMIQEEVWQQFGVMLEPEVSFLGECQDGAGRDCGAG